MKTVAWHAGMQSSRSNRSGSIGAGTGTMDGDIVKKLNEVPRQPSGVVKNVLDQCLKEAETGEIVAIGYAVVTGEGSINTGWAWERNVGSTRLIGAVSLLQHRLIHALEK